jgi:tetratricopeptide (TPR) repeat protein
MDVKILDAATREVLKSASARGDGLNSILRSQVDEISRAVSRGIGKPVLKLEAPPRPIMDLTTNSVEAYNYFLRGRDDVENLMGSDAKKFLEKAIALDPTFAVAYLYLSSAESLLVDYKAKNEALMKAKEYAERATEKERLYIEAEYASTIERDSEKRRRLLLELTQKYPQEKFAHYELGNYYYSHHFYPEAEDALERAVALDPDFGPAFNMLGYTYGRAGEYEKAEKAFESYIAANPGDPNPLDSLAELYLRSGQLDKSEARYREALEARPDFTGSCLGLAFISALRENYDETFRWLDEHQALATPTGKMEGLGLIHFYEFLVGRLEDSLAGYLALRKIGESYDQDIVIAYVDWILGPILADLGRFDEAREALQSGNRYFQRMYPDRKSANAADFAILLGQTDLEQGRLQSARARLEEAKSLLPEITDRNNFERDSFRCQLLEAEVALSGGNPDDAVAVAGRLKLPDFPGMNTPAFLKHNSPFLIDVLARAYWKKGDLENAAAEYRKLMTIAPSNRVRRLIHPLYHYRLGRVLEEKGDRAGAAGEYRKFLEYWKNADKTHPELADARTRLASLGSDPR